jgi:sugar phosphate isomerase/epimerase
MRLELSTSYAIHLPAEEAVLRCYKLGFLNIQLGTPHRKANLDKLLKIKDSLGFEYSVHAPFPAPRKFMVNPVYPSETRLENGLKVGC